MDATLAWVQQTALATRLRDSLLLFPLIQATHVLGVSLVVGTATIIDLRLLGLASTTRPFSRMTADIMKWTWAAFTVTVVMGALMFITNAQVYFHNSYFRAKVAFLLLAGLNVLVFQSTAGRTVDRWDREPSAPRLGRLVAAVSLLIWVGIIFSGRMVGFTSTRTALPEPANEDVNFEELLGLPGGNAPAPSNPAPQTPPR